MTRIRTSTDDHRDWLRKRMQKLEDALREIANHPTGGVGCNPQTFVETARKALEE